MKDESVQRRMTYISLLGPVRAWSDHEELNLGTPQQRALFALLLLHRQPVRTTVLVNQLWDTRPPVHAVEVVRTCVYGLRRNVQIETEDDGYTLKIEPGTMIDLDHFQHLTRNAGIATENGKFCVGSQLLKQALDLWRGDPLTGLSGTYLDSERVRIERLYLRAVEHQALTRMTVGDHVGVATDLPEILRRYPHEEKLAEIFMHALYRSGRQVDAITAYLTFQRSLRETMGTDPGSGVQKMYQRILTAHPSLFSSEPALDRERSRRVSDRRSSGRPGRRSARFSC